MTQGRDRVARLHRERLNSLLRVCAGVICAGLTLAATAVPTAATARLSWSPARLIDPGSGLGRGVSLSGVSCPSVSLCVAVDDAGDVVTSTAPTSGARWTIAHVDRGHGWQPTLDGVSCPSASLCVAVDDAGDAVTSTAPTAGKGHWQIAPVDRDHGPLDGVSCPSVSLCVAVDDAGDVLTSTDPTGGPGYWSRTHVEDPSGSDDQLDGVSCPSVTLCVAVNFQRQVLTSTNPTGGAAAWRVTPVPGGDGLPLDSISCSSPSLCVATGQDGGLAITTNPTGGERAWVTRSLDAPPLFGVSCAPGGPCVTVDSNGDAFASTAGASTWVRARVDPNNELSAVSCPSARRCVAVDDSGNVVVAPWTATNSGIPRLAGAARHSVHLPGRSLLVDSGLVVQCPADGPACTLRGEWSVSPYATRHLSAIGRWWQRIQPGTQRVITFPLTTKAAGLLRKHKQLVAQVRFIASAGRRGAVAQHFDLILTP